MAGKRGRPPKHLSKEMCVKAISVTSSAAAAARYLGVSYLHFKRWARTYDATEPGYENLLEQCKNQSGKGIPKYMLHKEHGYSLDDIVHGRIRATHFDPQKIKERLVVEGYLKYECNRCGMDERRVIDDRAPLLLSFKDSNKINFSVDNIEMLCYNCYFLYHGNIFSDKDIENLESYMPTPKKDEVDWNLDDFQKQHLKELGLWDQDDDDEIDYSDLISKE